MPAAPRSMCANCPHPLKWHRHLTGDCLHEGCPCDGFMAAPKQARRPRLKYPPIPPDLRDRCCGVCRGGQHSRCVGRRNESGRAGNSPKAPCECPCRKREATP